MIEIDGSEGEGGGQIVRSSLALSLLTGKSFRIFNVRAGRKKPGLKLQHLTAFEAATQIGNAVVTGAELGSREISFQPSEVTPGEWKFQIATAGSVTLVLQTVLPPLMMAGAPSKVMLCGGTHNMMAPAFDFLKKSFVPLLRRIGPQVELTLHKHGFYPVGGGRFEAEIIPSDELNGLEVMERGKLLQRHVRSIVSALPIRIAHRETARVIRKLNWDRVATEHIDAPNPVGPGNVLFAELEYENLTSVFTGFGRQGVPAEKVADAVVRDVRNYLKSDAPVGPHLADQLMLPMAIAAAFSKKPGRFRTVPLTQHSLTQAEIIQRFLDVNIELDTNEDASATVRVNPISQKKRLRNCVSLFKF